MYPRATVSNHRVWEQSVTWSFPTKWFMSFEYKRTGEFFLAICTNSLQYSIILLVSAMPFWQKMKDCALSSKHENNDSKCRRRLAQGKLTVAWHPNEICKLCDANDVCTQRVTHTDSWATVLQTHWNSPFQVGNVVRQILHYSAQCARAHVWGVNK